MDDSLSTIDWSVPDWSREQPAKFWDPGKKLTKSIRDFQKIKQKGFFGYMRRRLCIYRHKFWTVITGAEIDLTCRIGGGLLLPHPSGIVIHPDTVIGVNCLIFQQVTVTKGVDIGDHVDIGAGAKILGPLSIGDNVRIGANAVVTHNIRSGSTVVGIPAREIETPK